MTSMAELDRRAYAAAYGPTTGDRVRLADTSLWVEVTSDDVGFGDEILGGCGKTFREAMLATSKAGPSELDMLVANVVLLDPVLGVRKTSIGIKDGRIAAVGRAGNPDLVDGVELVAGAHTALVPGEGLIATPGIVDSHVHLSSPALLEAALSAGTTTLVAMGMGGVWDVGVNPPRNLETLLAGMRQTPVNMAFLARGSALDPRPLSRALESGASGFKVHEDFGACPAIVDTCLGVAEEHDVAVALHTDSLCESGSLAETIAATAGRTVHAYHVEGGGGHPDLLEIVSVPHVLPSSTTPTIPASVNTVAELLPMTMTVHRMTSPFGTDEMIASARVHAAGIAAENALHDLGAISIINSDSMGMGRIGEVVRRTFQLASLATEQAGSHANGADNDRVLRFLAKVTINPSIAHGLAREVGSLEPGKLADIVLWHPAWFGAKPELVIKSGFVAWGASGSGSGSTRITQPRTYRPFFGGLGAAAERLATLFVAQATIDAGWPASRQVPVRVAPVRDARRLTRAHMVRNDTVPSVHVPPDGSAVSVDGELMTMEPAAQVPLGQLFHLA
jgi:urease subunit alpha